MIIDRRRREQRKKLLDSFFDVPRVSAGALGYTVSSRV